MSKTDKQYGPTMPWPPDMKAYIVAQLAAGVDFRAIYTDVMAPNCKEKFGFRNLHPDAKYRTFTNRCHALPVELIETAREKWKLSFDDVFYSTQKARAAALDKILKLLMERLDDEGAINMDFLAETRKMLLAMGKEMNAEADRAALAASGTNVLIANPKRVELDADLLNEMVMTLRHDFKGIQNVIKFDRLELHELQAVKELMNHLIIARHAALEETGVVEEYEDEEE